MTRVAACQISLDIENPAQNFARANKAIADAIVQGAQIIVLPELTNSGYAFTSVAEVQERSTTLDGELISHWKEIAHQSDVVIVAGLALSVDSRGIQRCISLAMSINFSKLGKNHHLLSIHLTVASQLWSVMTLNFLSGYALQCSIVRCC